MIQVMWGNSLGKLADRLVARLADEKTGHPSGFLGRQHCIVVPNRILQNWFKHHFLYDMADTKPKVLANVDYILLHQFVNDWIYRMRHPVGNRDPAAHPFAVANMQWRIYSALTGPLVNGADCEPLRDYIQAAGPDGAAVGQRTFRLAAQLAKLFDNYQVYRPEMMQNWSNGSNESADGHTMRWQPELWRHITDGLYNETYLASFIGMDRDLDGCGIGKNYHAVHVFGISMMPKVYARFFDLLSEKGGIPVYLYLFNPCREDWDTILTPGQTLNEKRRAALQGIPEEELLLDIHNPLLANLGRGCRDLLAHILDHCQGQVEDDSFLRPVDNTVLGRIQAGILDNIPTPPQPCRANRDDSLVIHVCHSPMREIEILREHLLRWFTEDSTLQPRHVQVLVSDIALYAPYIDAVFATEKKNAAHAIPYAVADRVSVGESVIGEAFSRLLAIAGSRFQAPAVMELLQCESIYRAFGLSAGDLDTINAMVRAAGIRWGTDSLHRKNETGADFTECTTWQHGLDRLMLGFVFSREYMRSDPDMPLACDMVEGDGAEILGRLMRFSDCLQDAAHRMSREMTPGEWQETLAGLIDTFFAATSESFRDINSLRSLAESFGSSCRAAGFDDPVPAAVVRDFFAGQLANAAGGGNITGNCVVFGSLRAGAIPPRRIVCLLGMGDRLFPRSDNRPAYDIFRKQHFRGDPSVRTEDRMAFLEAVVNAGRKLYISYVGRTLKEDEVIPPSTLVSELQDYIRTMAGPDAVEPVIHRLQPFNPVYFTGDSDEYFSYDKANCRAAATIASGPARKSPADAPATDPEAIPLPEMRIELDELTRFFKNPAECYYRTLKARISILDTGQLEENEEFSPAGLSAYRINTEICRILLETPDNPADNPKLRQEIYLSLLQQGMLPLGVSGRNWFDGQYNELINLLATPPGEVGENAIPLRELISRQASLTDSPVQARIGKTVITGAVSGWRTSATGEAALIITTDFRCASEKAWVTLESWIRHLFATAAGFQGRRYCIQASKTEKISQAVFPAMTPEDAAGIMARLLAVYAHGQTAIPPFTPATSSAYIKGFNKKIPKDTPVERIYELRRAAGMKQAAIAWYSDTANGRYGDDSNDHFKLAFGKDGPMDVDENGFRKFANLVFGPLLHAIDPAGGVK